MDKKKLSERDICTKLITPALGKAGWDIDAQIREEVRLTKGRVIVRGKLVARGKEKRELDSGIKLKDKLDQLLIDAGKQTETLPAIADAANEAFRKTTEELARTTEVSQKASALLATIQQSETTSTQQLAATKSSNAEISALEKKIKEFYNQVDEYRNKISTAAEDANNIIQKNTTETEKLIATLRDLEDQIKTQMQKATGYSLFHSFQTRKDALVWSKRIWASALGLLVLMAIGLPWFVIKTTINIDVAFFLKLSMSLPIIYAIAFCAIQYSRERKLEEEYAFKSNISISLVPYQELVDKLVAKDHPAEREKYAAFIMDSISKVFSSPTDKVFDNGEKQKGLSTKMLKQLSAIIETIKGIKS